MAQSSPSRRRLIEAIQLAYINPGASPAPWQRPVLTLDAPGAVKIALADPDGDGKPEFVFGRGDGLYYADLLDQDGVNERA